MATDDLEEVVGRLKKLVRGWLGLPVHERITSKHHEWLASALVVILDQQKRIKALEDRLDAAAPPRPRVH